MDGLRLLTATGLGSSTSPVRQWGSDIILAAVAGVITFVCAFMVAGWGAASLYLWLQPQMSNPSAAGLTALAFLALIGVILGGLKWYFGRNQAPRQPEPAANEFGLGNLDNLSQFMPPPGQPMKAWDLATLVAVGVITGLSKGQPR
jgi:hypothetical protein